jgi:hypothetical protein
VSSSYFPGRGKPRRCLGESIEERLPSLTPIYCADGDAIGEHGDRYENCPKPVLGGRVDEFFKEVHAVKGLVVVGEDDVGLAE